MRNAFIKETAVFSILAAVCLTLAVSCENLIMHGILELKVISFNTNGGSFIQAQRLLKGQVLTRPDDPVKQDSIFGGWYKDNDTFAQEWDFNVSPTEDLTLHAKWNYEYAPVIEPGAAEITLSIEDIIAQVPSPSLNDITLSKTGANKTQTITVTGAYQSIEWKAAGVGAYDGEFAAGSGSSFTLDADDEKYGTIGGHSLMLTVYVDGNPYMVNIRFTIEN